MTDHNFGTELAFPGEDSSTVFELKGIGENDPEYILKLIGIYRRESPEQHIRSYRDPLRGLA